MSTQPTSGRPHGGIVIGNARRAFQTTPTVPATFAGDTGYGPPAPTRTVCVPGAATTGARSTPSSRNPLNNLGRCYLSENRFAEALDCLRRALESHRAAGNRHQQAVSLQLLGTAQARTGMTEEARGSRAQAIAIFEELGDTVMSDQVRAERSEI
jgi:tetratricopeptide (TPR) repeat protein